MTTMTTTTTTTTAESSIGRDYSLALLGIRKHSKLSAHADDTSVYFIFVYVRALLCPKYRAYTGLDALPCMFITSMGVDTRGALGAEASPSQIFWFYIIHYI